MAEKKQFIGDFRELEVYKKALIFSNKIYKIVEKFPAYERNNLVDQLRRASSSCYGNMQREMQIIIIGKNMTD